MVRRPKEQDRIGLQSCTCQQGQLSQSKKDGCNQTKCLQMSTELNKTKVLCFKGVNCCKGSHALSLYMKQACRLCTQTPSGCSVRYYKNTAQKIREQHYSERRLRGYVRYVYDMLRTSGGGLYKKGVAIL
eukprot:136549-Pelagomonas_calceolata.AAC.1